MTKTTTCVVTIPAGEREGQNSVTLPADGTYQSYTSTWPAASSVSVSGQTVTCNVRFTGAVLNEPQTVTFTITYTTPDPVQPPVITGGGSQTITLSSSQSYYPAASVDSLAKSMFTVTGATETHLQPAAQNMYPGQTLTFHLVASGPGGTVTSSGTATISVVAPPPPPTPPVISGGGSRTITLSPTQDYLPASSVEAEVRSMFTVYDADDIWVSPATVDIYPGQSQTYRLKASNEAGTTTSSNTATISVIRPTVSVALKATFVKDYYARTPASVVKANALDHTVPSGDDPSQPVLTALLYYGPSGAVEVETVDEPGQYAIRASSSGYQTGTSSQFSITIKPPAQHSFAVSQQCYIEGFKALVDFPYLSTYTVSCSNADQQTITPAQTGNNEVVFQLNREYQAGNAIQLFCNGAVAIGGSPQGVYYPIVITGQDELIHSEIPLSAFEIRELILSKFTVLNATTVELVPAEHDMGFGTTEAYKVKGSNAHYLATSEATITIEVVRPTVEVVLDPPFQTIWPIGTSADVIKASIHFYTDPTGDDPAQPVFTYLVKVNPDGTYSAVSAITESGSYAIRASSPNYNDGYSEAFTLTYAIVIEGPSSVIVDYGDNGTQFWPNFTFIPPTVMKTVMYNGVDITVFRDDGTYRILASKAGAQSATKEVDVLIRPTISGDDDYRGTVDNPITVSDIIGGLTIGTSGPYTYNVSANGEDIPAPQESFAFATAGQYACSLTVYSESGTASRPFAFTVRITSASRFPSLTTYFKSYLTDGTTREVMAGCDVSAIGNTIKADYQFTSSTIADFELTKVEAEQGPLAMPYFAPVGVSYTNQFGSFDSFQFKLGTFNGVPYANTSSAYDTSSPLAMRLPNARESDFSLFYFSSPRLLYQKDYGNAHALTYQLHFLPEKGLTSRIILGYNLIERLVRFDARSDNQRLIYLSRTTYSKFENRKAKGARIAGTPYVSCTGSTATLSLPEDIDLGGYKAWAIANKNGELLLAYNFVDPFTQANDYRKSLTFSFGHKRGEGL